MVRISRDHVIMTMAETIAKRGTCSRSQVGVVIELDGRPLSVGYNGAPAGMPHCTHHCNCATPRHHEPQCKSLLPCMIAVHGEANAIAWAARHGIATQGSGLFTTLAPCTACAMLIINAGVARVRYLADYRLSDGVELLKNAGVDIQRYGLIG